MKCPVCRSVTLEPQDLQWGLHGDNCPQCSGHWVRSFEYWRWRERSGPELPELPPAPQPGRTPDEVTIPKQCPECRAILVPYSVGHGFTFKIDRCGHCGGMWFDSGEWEALKARNLHDDAHLIFSTVWQRQIGEEERRAAHEEMLKAKLGADDLAEIRRVRAWVEAHPQSDLLLAFLLHGEE